MVIEPVPSLFSYFRSRVADASARRRVETTEATADYLANLLVSFGTGAGRAMLERSIVLTLDEALSSSRGEQLLGLQAVGDGALYLVSFFPEHLERAGLDTSLYVNVGAFAYGRAAEILRATGSQTTTALIELNSRFPQIVDVLGEVAESSALGAVTRDLVKLFDRWKNTGSSRALESLARQGAFPAPGGGRKC